MGLNVGLYTTYISGGMHTQGERHRIEHIPFRASAAVARNMFPELYNGVLLFIEPG